ncbi:hypothetical protein E6O75_ATG07473 [Venturia nashicola]|uniref:Uncharacterized protein n=1 Tax=Venturia nashicola TaxID=86259 RepID=A0A4Z1P1H2_9PEZI|nr:hypothetical protein E6O75_ATG07473 [Venturia nashicola]
MMKLTNTQPYPEKADVRHNSGYGIRSVKSILILPKRLSSVQPQKYLHVLLQLTFLETSPGNTPQYKNSIPLSSKRSNLTTYPGKSAFSITCMTPRSLSFTFMVLTELMYGRPNPLSVTNEGDFVLKAMHNFLGETPHLIAIAQVAGMHSNLEAPTSYTNPAVISLIFLWKIEYMAMARDVGGSSYAVAIEMASDMNLKTFKYMAVSAPGHTLLEPNKSSLTHSTTSVSTLVIPFASSDLPSCPSLPNNTITDGDLAGSMIAFPTLYKKSSFWSSLSGSRILAMTGSSTFTEAMYGHLVGLKLTTGPLSMNSYLNIGLNVPMHTLGYTFAMG